MIAVEIWAKQITHGSKVRRACGVQILIPMRCEHCGMISTPHLYCDIECHSAAHPDEYMDCMDSCVDDGWRYRTMEGGHQ